MNEIKKCLWVNIVAALFIICAANILLVWGSHTDPGAHRQESFSYTVLSGSIIGASINALRAIHKIEKENGGKTGG